MSQIDLDLAFGPVAFPASTVLGSIVASLQGSDTTVAPAVQTVPAGTADIAFPNVAPDTYTYSVQQLDESGNALGNPISGQVVVSAPATVTLQVPTSVSSIVS